jgi:hypothetical protein
MISVFPLLLCMLTTQAAPTLRPRSSSPPRLKCPNAFVECPDLEGQTGALPASIPGFRSLSGRRNIASCWKPRARANNGSLDILLIRGLSAGFHPKMASKSTANCRYETGRSGNDKLARGRGLRTCRMRYEHREDTFIAIGASNGGSRIASAVAARRALSVSELPNGSSPLAIWKRMHPNPQTSAAGADRPPSKSTSGAMKP